MSVACALLVFILAVCSASEVEVGLEATVEHSAYGYLVKHGIPAAERVRRAEENLGRIVGGVPAAAGQYPWQAALLTDIMGQDQDLVALCGASLVSASRLVTAAHCWNDGVNQGWRITVILGSTRLFSGGTRVQTSAIAVHPQWSPLLARADIAVIYLLQPVTLSNVIAPISIPTGAEIDDSFAGEGAIASGFGLVGDDVPISQDQSLSHVRLNVITNGACSWAFPLIISNAHLCTSGVGSVGVCHGDSGGPLIVTRGNRNVLIGVASFVSPLGCQSGLPSVFTRVSSHVNFLNQHID